MWIALLAVMLCLSGCGASGDSTLDEGKGEREMIELTFEASKALNERSDLGGCTLLGEPPEDIFGNGPVALNDVRDYYCFFPYDSRTRITQVVLRSENVNVFGIGIGQPYLEADPVLTSEGYSCLPVQQTAYLGKIHAAVYQKGHICVAFLIAEDQSGRSDAPIVEIVVDVSDPNEDGPVY
jgi:hypothetical protein